MWFFARQTEQTFQIRIRILDKSGQDDCQRASRRGQKDHGHRWSFGQSPDLRFVHDRMVGFRLRVKSILTPTLRLVRRQSCWGWGGNISLTHSPSLTNSHSLTSLSHSLTPLSHSLTPLSHSLTHSLTHFSFSPQSLLFLTSITSLSHPTRFSFSPRFSF